MKSIAASEPGPRYRAYTTRHLGELTERAGLSAAERLQVQAVAAVLPFRTNNYVLDHLIDWSSAPDDPIYRLVFPQADMLSEQELWPVIQLLRLGAPAAEVHAAAGRIRARLNPHPAGQLDLNVPTLYGRPLRGLQHKYRETVLYFPRQGQTCHAYCTYCFRWAQFVGEPDLKIAADDDTALLPAYLRAHPEVTDVLVTGGDPMIMSTAVLSAQLEPLLALEQVESIRIGTKALAYWPYRFLSDPDADALLRLFERVTGAGKSVSVMAHFSHPRELDPAPARAAVARIRGTGAMIRTQAPLIRSINDTAGVWEAMWREQVRLGLVPYYMFVERDTGPQDYFAVPLARAWEIYRAATSRVSGLSRTVRGPSMSATPGKVCIDGLAEVNGERVFVLRLIQARDASLVGRPFFARYDPTATWLSDLVPAFAERFPFHQPGASGAGGDEPGWARPSAGRLHGS